MAISNHLIGAELPSHEWSVMAAPTPMLLTVAQIETLAKAGVKVELATPVFVQDNPPIPTTEAFGSPGSLIAMVRDRWKMAMKAKHGESHDHRFLNDHFNIHPLLAAAKHGDKVYIFVVAGNTPPHVIEDDVAIFPSDALLAKLHLLMEFGNGQ